MIHETADRAATPLGVIMSVAGAATLEIWIMLAGLALTALSVWLRHRHNKRMEAINRERLELERRR